MAFFDKLLSALDAFTKQSEKELESIRKEKAEIQRLKDEIEVMVKGRYIRDDERIIISAPEIIIGNVDRDGVLRSDTPYSHVVIRSNNIDLEGASPAGTTGCGSITQRASVISTIAVDPGIDGVEDFVCERSAIIQQARSITLDSNKAADVFTSLPASPSSGILINSDSKVDINATVSREGNIKALEAEIAKLNSVKDSLKTSAKKQERIVGDKTTEIEKCLDEKLGLTENEYVTAINLGSIYKNSEDLRKAKGELASALSDYISLCSKQAETNRKLKALKTAKEVLDRKNKFKEETTGCAVSINGEIINMTSVDGDGNLRTNKEASINMKAQNMNFTSCKENGELMEKGVMTVNTKCITLSTANHITNNEGTKSPAVGSVKVLSKEVTIEGVNYKKEGNKDSAFDDQTEGGKLSVRMENVNFLSADKDGKCKGTYRVNSKSIHIKSMDVDKDFKDKELAEDSWLQLASNIMNIGQKKMGGKQYKCCDVMNVLCDTLKFSPNKQLGIYDKDNTNVLSLNQSKLTSYVETKHTKKLTVNAESEFKGEMTVGDGKFTNLEVTGAFKSKSFNDGIAVPGVLAEERPPEAKEKEEERMLEEKNKTKDFYQDQGDMFNAYD